MELKKVIVVNKFGDDDIHWNIVEKVDGIPDGSYLMVNCYHWRLYDSNDVWIPVGFSRSKKVLIKKIRALSSKK